MDYNTLNKKKICESTLIKKFLMGEEKTLFIFTENCQLINVEGIEIS